MKSNKAKSLMMIFLAVVMLLAGIGSTTANAQGRRIKVVQRPQQVIIYRTYNPFWYSYYDPFWSSHYYPQYVVVDPIAYQKELGYSEGKDEGEKDAKKGRPANATGHKDYIKSDSQAFREAFIEGYNKGYKEEIADIREEMNDRD